MNRKEVLQREFEEMIPAGDRFWLRDVADLLRRRAAEQSQAGTLVRPLVSLRTLQRACESGSLPAMGGEDRNVRHYRVRRADLIDYLVGLDSLVERPAAASSPAPQPARRAARRRGTRKKKGGAKPSRRGTSQRAVQTSFFDEP